MKRTSCFIVLVLFVISIYTEALFAADYLDRAALKLIEKQCRSEIFRECVSKNQSDDPAINSRLSCISHFKESEAAYQAFKACYR